MEAVDGGRLVAFTYNCAYLSFAAHVISCTGKWFVKPVFLTTLWYSNTCT